MSNASKTTTNRPTHRGANTPIIAGEWWRIRQRKYSRDQKASG